MPSHYTNIVNEEQDWAPVTLNNSQKEPKIEKTRNFGQQICFFRSKANITATQLAQSISIPIKQLEKYENNEEIPSKATITKINRMCNCNLFRYMN